MKAVSYFPGFKYPSSALIKYINVIRDFTIMLENGEFIKFTPNDEQAFLNWLDENNISNIRKEAGWILE